MSFIRDALNICNLVNVLYPPILTSLLGAMGTRRRYATPASETDAPGSPISTMIHELDSLHLTSEIVGLPSSSATYRHTTFNDTTVVSVRSLKD